MTVTFVFVPPLAERQLQLVLGSYARPIIVMPDRSPYSIEAQIVSSSRRQRQTSSPVDASPGRYGLGNVLMMASRWTSARSTLRAPLTSRQRFRRHQQSDQRAQRHGSRRADFQVASTSTSLRSIARHRMSLGQRRSNNRVRRRSKCDRDRRPHSAGRVGTSCWSYRRASLPRDHVLAATCSGGNLTINADRMRTLQGRLALAMTSGLRLDDIVLTGPGGPARVITAEPSSRPQDHPLRSSATATNGNMIVNVGQFTNNAGATALNADGGRVLVYSTNWANDNRGGLTGRQSLWTHLCSESAEFDSRWRRLCLSRPPDADGYRRRSHAHVLRAQSQPADDQHRRAW